LPKKDGFEGQWKSRNANLEIHTDENALYKTSRGLKTKVRTGVYYNPVLTANGNWVVVTKSIEYEQSLVRINLLTNKEFKLKLPNEVPNVKAESFVTPINKMLIFAGYDYSRGDDYESEVEAKKDVETKKEGTYYLLDVETGVFQEVKGEISPLTQQTFRPLQPTANPNEFWAAIKSEKSTEFGRYDSKLLKFKSSLKLPEILFNSMDMFVDEKEAKIYFVYERHLLRIPLPK
jgi:hypothetical protein